MSTSSQTRIFDVEAVRRDFPMLSRTMHGKPLAFLDNGASSQKPQVVIDAERRVYEEHYANIHRGVYELSQRSTDAHEAARESVARLLNAGSSKEIIFTRGTTEAINLVAQSYGRRHVGAGDEVLITAMEHHSNIVPWQMLCEEKQARLRVAPIDESGTLILEEFERLLGAKTKLVAITHVSNALGTINPISQVAKLASRRGVPVLVDGAQAVPRLPVDVQSLGVDFYAFSGHKAYGPSGAGALWGRKALLEEMPPWQGGGDMILSVSFGKTIYNDVPFKFEAGTPNIAGNIAFGVACDYLRGLGMEAVEAWEGEVLRYAEQRLRELPGIEFVGTARHKAGVVSFLLENIHPHDIGTILDHEGVAIRAGHHCAQPVMDRFGIAATARASFGLYNTLEEVDRLVAALVKVKEMFDP